MKGSACMGGNIIFDERSTIDGQLYKYDEVLHNRINKYTGDGRTIVTYFSINDDRTTDSFGLNDAYQILGPDSPFRFNRIEDFPLLGFSPLQPEDTQASTTTVRNYNLQGEAFVIPGTVQPKENDFFIVRQINMNHLFRVSAVGQDGLNTDGSYKISYELFSTNPQEIEWVYKQTVSKFKTDLQTIGGHDLTPVIGVEDYEHRSRLIRMVNDMVDNYIARFYDKRHNCLIYRGNGEAIFDPCGNKFMAKHGLLINDNAYGNIVLNEDKLRMHDIAFLYEKSPFKWIERDAPLRYLDTFKYHMMDSYNFVNSSFPQYGDNDIQVMIPNDPWCDTPYCETYFPNDIANILANENDCQCAPSCQCKCCAKVKCCCCHYKQERFTYVQLIHDFIHGKLKSIKDLSLYSGDQLFDNGIVSSKEIYLWTPIIIYIIKQVLLMKE